MRSVTQNEVPLCFLCLFVTLLFCFPQRIAGGTTIVLVGGNLHDDNEQIYTKIIDLAGGKQRALIGVVTCASDDPVGSFQSYVPTFLQFGALDVTWIPIDSEGRINNTYSPTVCRLNPPNKFQVLDIINAQTGFYFGGGDQDRLQRAFLPDGKETPALTLLRKKFSQGVVFSGSSAGVSKNGILAKIFRHGYLPRNSDDRQWRKLSRTCFWRFSVCPTSTYNPKYFSDVFLLCFFLI